MGSTMKSTIFNERVAMALRNWHHGAKKHVKQQNRRSQTQTPLSGPTTPDHSVSQAHLLRRWHSETDTYPTNSEAQHPYEIDLGPSSKVHHQEMEMDQLDHGPPENVNDRSQHEINIEHSKEFSFDNKWLKFYIALRFYGAWVLNSCIKCEKTQNNTREVVIMIFYV